MTRQKYALITVRKEYDVIYRIPVTDENDGWNREPTEFTDDQIHEDLGGNVEITDVEMED